MTPSKTHLVLIPSYNTGDKVYDTVRAARAQWAPVWVVVDGSTDGTAEGLLKMAEQDPQLRVLVSKENHGKGAAVLLGLRVAVHEGYTHLLTMDSDGQHPPEKIPEFMQVSIANPDGLVLGRPVFDASAPMLRVRGRRVSNWWANFETLWQGIGDSLYGFRVYPAQMLLGVMENSYWMRH
ncbi:MAG: glycosyltransferase family 2 protein, partial [Sideroxyarcus sp.]|nr:glycosyltransferase family 2 protein [Sideroxyarcus sp.]